MIWLLLLSVFSLSIIQLFSEKHPWWRMTPIAVCILFGTRVVLTAHFPLLAPTSSLLVQSGSKLWPKSAKERLAAKGIDQSRSDHDSKQSQQCHPGGSDGDFGWSHGVMTLLMPEVVVSPECPTNRSVLRVLRLGLELLRFPLLLKPGSLHFPSDLWDAHSPPNKGVSCLIWLQPLSLVCNLNPQWAQE